MCSVTGPGLIKPKFIVRDGGTDKMRQLTLH